MNKANEHAHESNMATTGVTDVPEGEARTKLTQHKNNPAIFDYRVQNPGNALIQQREVSREVNNRM